MRTLKIYSNGIQAGILTEKVRGKRYEFCYLDSYLLSPDSNPISVTLPLRSEAYHSPYLFPYFSNMLPEGTNKKLLCQVYKIDEKDEFGLLALFSQKDIIGAVTVKEVKDERD